MYKVNEGNVKEIISLYNENSINVRQIAKKFNISRDLVYYYLKKNNIPRREQEFAQRRYVVYDNVFDEIDTWNKAYGLGLLYSDGCNFEPQNKIVLQMTEKDVEVLRFFSDLVSKDKPLYVFNNQTVHSRGKEYTRKKMMGMNIFSSHMSEVLAKKYGVVNNKSLILKHPTNIKDDFLRALYLGVFDGDGCFGESHTTTTSYTLVATIAGTKDFMEVMGNNIFRLSGIQHKLVHDETNHLFYIKYLGSLLTLRFGNWLYEDAPFFMKRKFERYALLANQKYVHLINGKYDDVNCQDLKLAIKIIDKNKAKLSENIINQLSFLNQDHEKIEELRLKTVKSKYLIKYIPTYERFFDRLINESFIQPFENKLNIPPLPAL